MPIIKFDYEARPIWLDKKKKIIDALYTPIVQIRIAAHHKMYPRILECLVDSGSDYNLLPADIADLLGIKLKRGEEVEHIGIGDVGIIAYRHKVKLFIQKRNFETYVDFSRVNKFQILGRYAFFRFFKKVTFDEVKKRLELKY